MMRTLWKSGPAGDGGGWIDEVTEMYRVADDYEAQTLDELRLKAGITWECYGEDGDSCWTNHRDDPKCDRCARPRVYPVKEYVAREVTPFCPITGELREDCECGSVGCTG